MSTIAVRFKSVFIPSARHSPQPSPLTIHSSFPTSESTTPMMPPSTPEAQPGPMFASTTSRASTGSSTIHFSIEQSDTTHIHRPRRANTAGHVSPRTRSFDGSSAPGSPRRSPTTRSAHQRSPSALSYVKMPIIPGYCF